MPFSGSGYAHFATASQRELTENADQALVRDVQKSAKKVSDMARPLH